MPERRVRKHYRPKTIYSKEYEVFLRLLREARERSGLTQEQIAERMKQDQAMVSRCFTGSRRVDIVKLRSFLAAMGLRFSDFVLAMEAEWDADARRSEATPSGSSEAVVPPGESVSQ